ncbi:MAG: phosphate ABC transporter substrate-binding protein [Gammaproteobacteria bacterium]|nr:phosphate ABC transporter substrate-binding protein [Gammaproteobacteria bacterium]MCW8987741.1 phosphate ABC transporter substrate-binding protein [Gammaproteobacteria bacterium]
MKKLFKLFSLSIVISSLYLVAPIANAGVAVITHPGVKEIGLSKDKLAQIYLGKIKNYSNGRTINAVDLPNDSDAHKKFYKSVVQKSDSAMNRYWSKLKFTGKGNPPKELGSDSEVVKWVANTEGAIGYIDGKYLNKSVKVVLILP